MDKKDFQMMMGCQVRLHRKAQGFSQEKLAELAEVHPTFISNIERGKISASAYNLYRVAQALGIKFGDLLGMFEDGDDIAFEKKMTNIMAKIRHLDEVQRELYLGAISGMLPK